MASSEVSGTWQLISDSVNIYEEMKQTVVGTL